MEDLHASAETDGFRLDRSGIGTFLAIVDRSHRPAELDASWQNYARQAVEIGLGYPGVAQIASQVVKLATRSGSPSQVALLSSRDAAGLEAQDLLTFPEGPPVLGEVYVRHPMRHREYWPFVDYHRLLIQEKSVEAVRFLLSLGAVDVTIRCLQDVGTAGAVKGDVPTPEAIDISGSMGFELGKDGELSIAVTGAGRKMETPTDLTWPARDPLFKLARDAADAGAKTFRFGIKSGQTRTVNAAIGAKLESLGLKIGGEYKNWENLTFSVTAKFDQPTSQHLT